MKPAHIDDEIIPFGSSVERVYAGFVFILKYAAG
jgi:hypothetical protein